MGRPVGRTNKGHETEKQRLAGLIAARLLQTDGTNASFQELAETCAVSRATLRHYFQDHHGAVQAAIDSLAQQGDVHIASVVSADLGTARDAISALIRLFALAWQRYGVGAIQRMGLAIGLHDAQIGPFYIQKLLEPTLQAFEQRLQIHIQRGELRPMDTRTGALLLLSPLILALLHQDQLGGRTCRPLDIDAFLSEHLEAFFRAWSATPPLPEQEPP
ncbi:TetR/AcrR family transcriptional regulator [Myxococcota bacterium]|nr:TetR/AcrR family transcriptional regulator [Myxococcota bacterium]